MRNQYNIIAELDPTLIYEPIKEVVDSVNNTMAMFDKSFPKIGLKSTVPIGVFKITGELTEDLKYKVMTVMNSEFLKSTTMSHVVVIDMVKI